MYNITKRYSDVCCRVIKYFSWGLIDWTGSQRRLEYYADFSMTSLENDTEKDITSPPSEPELTLSLLQIDEMEEMLSEMDEIINDMKKRGGNFFDESHTENVAKIHDLFNTVLDNFTKSNVRDRAIASWFVEDDTDRSMAVKNSVPSMYLVHTKNMLGTMKLPGNRHTPSACMRGIITANQQGIQVEYNMTEDTFVFAHNKTTISSTNITIDGMSYVTRLKNVIEHVSYSFHNVMWFLRNPELVSEVPVCSAENCSISTLLKDLEQHTCPPVRRYIKIHSAEFHDMAKDEELTIVFPAPCLQFKKGMGEIDKILPVNTEELQIFS